MPVQIPLQAVPAQTLQIVLGGQNTQISIYLAGSNLYADTALNDTYVSIGVLCRNLVPLVSTAAYSGFAGNILFVDTQGSDDPTYDGLGSRYQLLYVTKADYSSMVASSA